jgi:hypothetical protein
MQRLASKARPRGVVEGAREWVGIAPISAPVMTARMPNGARPGRVEVSAGAVIGHLPASR